MTAPRVLRTLSCMILAAACGGCALRPAPACPAGTHPMQDDRLFFGTATPHGSVDAAQWDDFLKNVVTPRFPSGLTTWQTWGQWQGKDGVLVREASHVVEVLHPDDAADARAVHEITAAYEARFEQEAVLRVVATACVAFE